MNLHRVYGPPGTGKTTYLARQVKRATEKYGGSAVIVASLTKTAANEVTGRNLPIPKDNVGTLHAHAYRALGRPKLAETPPGIEGWNEYTKEHNHPQYQLNSKAKNPEEAHLEPPTGQQEGPQLLADIMRRRACQQPPNLWPQRQQHFNQLWSQYKKETDTLDFTDLIETALTDTNSHPHHPTIMFYDEAQDMSKLEHALAHHWGRQADQIVMVGDPDQNLYEWRGAQPEAFTSPHAETEHTLSQSWRVPQAVCEYAIDWVQQIPDRPPITYQPTPNAGQITHDNHARLNNPNHWLEHAHAETEQGRTVMILATCEYMLKSVIAAARQRGIPFHNPYRPAKGDWNALRHTAPRIANYLRPDPKTWGKDARPWNWDEVDHWTEPLQANKALNRGSKAYIEHQAQPGPFGEPPNQADLQTLLELFPEDHHTHILNLNLDWYKQHLLAAKRTSLEYPINIAKRNPQLLRQKPRLIIGTIHSVKGGEADTVYLFPDLSAQGRQAYQHDPAPTIRQFYVGMTRTKDKLIIGGPSNPYYLRLPQCA